MLRDFQAEGKGNIIAEWNGGAQIVMPVFPTGSGKTVLTADIITDFDLPTVAIAHRQELLGQLALALNREQVAHSIMAPDPIVREIMKLQSEEHGRSWYSHNAPVRVAGVDTLIRRDPTKDRWFDRVRLGLVDEGHHVLAKNKWGRSVLSFPNCKRWMFPTAHALRGDGAGLGRHADGLVDSLVIGPHGRALVNRGFLTDYRLIAPQCTDLELDDLEPGKGGELNEAEVGRRIAKSSIVGDVVKSYLKWAPGKLGLTFAANIKEAKKLVDAYNLAGVPAELITNKTPTTTRSTLMRRFRERQILQLVSVDVLGEGTDVPAIEVVSMARPTASFQLYAQQFGRALRIMVHESYLKHWHSYTDLERLAIIASSIKPKAIVIDHVQNWKRHGLPDRKLQYTTDRRERKRQAPEDAEALKWCTNPECAQPYEAYKAKCPYCSEKRTPAGRSSPAEVDGDLHELSPEVLARLRGEIERVDAPMLHLPAGMDLHAAMAAQRRHKERQQGQGELRGRIALWAGYWKSQGHDDPEIMRRFWFTFGTDVNTAQTYGLTKASKLCEDIDRHLSALNVVALST